jgi:hypothetical protein
MFCGLFSEVGDERSAALADLGRSRWPQSCRPFTTCEDSDIAIVFSSNAVGAGEQPQRPSFLIF